jgi:glycylpeptide N-tetradecanoyltransferase
MTTPVNSNAVTSPTPVDLKKFSSQQLVQWIQQQENEKNREKHRRRMEKATSTDENKEHKFWHTQPVLKLAEDCGIDESGPIDCAVDIANVRQEPLSMPAGFEWCSLDIQDPDVLQEVYILLYKNYVEDDDCMFRFVVYMHYNYYSKFIYIL